MIPPLESQDLQKHQQLLVSGRSVYRFSLGFLCVTGVIFIGLSVHAFHFEQRRNAMVHRQQRVAQLAGTVVHLDEVLTMSARMAAMTGDLDWEARYRRYEPLLHHAIKEAITLAPESRSQQAATEVDEANRRLVEMQDRSFALVREGRVAEAQSLLLSDEYDVQKAIYAYGLQQVVEVLQAHAERIGAAQRQEARLAAIFATMVHVLLFVVLALGLWMMRVWQQALATSNTQLSRQAEELRALANTLDKRVAERTGELVRTNEELTRQQVEMRSLLEDLSDAKGQLERQSAEVQTANTRLKEIAGLKDEFVAKVSHELRTPLTSVKEGLSLILDGALGATTAEQQDFLKTMDGDLDRLTDLINNMLDISKIEAGRMRLVRVRLEIPKLLHSLLRSYQSILGQRTIRTELAEVPPIFGDTNRLLQVFTNLLSNAIKFTPQDGAITFRVGQQDGMVTVTVQDSGPGIASEDLSKLFQKFAQVGTATNAPRGTGLGLVVCKELTELHGGRIEVASEVGRGAAFTVLLPAYTDRFVLMESFRELLSTAGDVPHVGLVAIQTQPYLDAYGDPVAKKEAVERFASDVRQLLHRGDIVVTVDPSWVVALAAADAEGVKAIMKRLKTSLLRYARFAYGCAVCPEDSDDVFTLLECATSRVELNEEGAGGDEPRPPASSTQTGRS